MVLACTEQKKRRTSAWEGVNIVRGYHALLFRFQRDGLALALGSAKRRPRPIDAGRASPYINQQGELRPGRIA